MPAGNFEQGERMNKDVKDFKIAFIGAGSIVFTRRIVRDLLSVKIFQGIRITFHGYQ